MGHLEYSVVYVAIPFGVGYVLKFVPTFANLIEPDANFRFLFIVAAASGNVV